ncbi:hypothetical protein ACN429_19760 [Pseudomonas oryzihabitans]|uniref:AbiJ-related protein n=1 Tax=Pseudomonas oryzihabitans TaxID=47885 RepID=UPI00363AE89F
MPLNQTEHDELRALFRDILGNQRLRYTGALIPALLEDLGLDDCPTAETKAERLRGAVDVSTDEQVFKAAHRALEAMTLSVGERDAIQEVLWKRETFPAVPARYRRELAKCLDVLPLYTDLAGFYGLLRAVWQVDECETLGFFEQGPSLLDEIRRHHICNPDWDVLTVFDKVGAYKSSDARFCHFIEGLASSSVRPDDQAQRDFIAKVDQALAPCGVRFHTTLGSDGYQTAKLVSVNASAMQSPKNLIFASIRKPDLRLGNALDNDVEVVAGADDVLMYDRAIPLTGLLWRDLQLWFEASRGLAAGEGKDVLYRRLLTCLPTKVSPVQRLAFTTFYTAFGAEVPKLPALLPEVWFHWDAKTVEQRGKEALLRSRMDFLLLLPGGVRVVIEVDGKHHYADENGRASPQRYSEMMEADRALRLAGYEIYRFGGYELSQPGADQLLTQFWRSLFKRYSIIAVAHT